ncbi:MAG: hypothetical protein ABI488_00725 [Polyangiaceae bacterium]
MTPIIRINHEALARALEFYKSANTREVQDVLLVSPFLDDVALVRRHLPRARILVATVKTWDLNLAFPLNGKVDAVISSNVFHYSPDPSLWFKNVLNMTEFLVMEDLISRRRSTRPDGLCMDGERDATRYCYAAKGVKSDFPNAYDLSQLGDQILYFQDYEGGRNVHHVAPAPAPRHYCAVIRSSATLAAANINWSTDGYYKFRLPGLVAEARNLFR